MRKKYIVLLIDGMADYPIPDLEDKTPLEVAKTPYLKKLSKTAEMGLAKTIPNGFPPGSDVANLCVLGYDPKRFYTGRSSLEALNMGVELGADDVSLRCNLVTLSEKEDCDGSRRGDCHGDYREKVMKDYSAGEISTEEAKDIIEECQRRLGTQKFSFYPGVSYRHVVVWKDGNKDIKLTPPHDISDKEITEFLPEGNGSEELYKLMQASSEFLSEHPVNLRRKERGLPAANSIWLWGEGTMPNLESFKDKYGLAGSVISAVDLIKGLGVAAGLRTIDVPGATGRIDTNFVGKAQAALKGLSNGDDFVFLHLEAADEAGHQGSIETKIKAIEMADQVVLGTILEEISKLGEYALMILPDHYTPICKRTHVSDPVPFLIYDSKKAREAHGCVESSGAESPDGPAENSIERPAEKCVGGCDEGFAGKPGESTLGIPKNSMGEKEFTEANAKKTGLYFGEGYKLLDYFLRE